MAARMIMTVFHGTSLYLPDAYALAILENTFSFSFAVATETLFQLTWVIFSPNLPTNKVILPAFPESRAAVFRALSKNTFFKTSVVSPASVDSRHAPPGQPVC